MGLIFITTCITCGFNRSFIISNSEADFMIVGFDVIIHAKYT